VPGTTQLIGTLTSLSEGDYQGLPGQLM